MHDTTELRIKVVHRPTDTILPYCAYVYAGEEQTGAAGYGATREEAIERARETQAALGEQKPEEWIDF